MRLLAVIAASVLLGACVPKARYDQALIERELLATDLVRAHTELHDVVHQLEQQRRLLEACQAAESSTTPVDPAETPQE